MKKLLALILAVLMLVSFAACASEKDKAENEPNESVEATEGSSPIETDENLLTVTVNLMASFFEGETEEEIKAKAKENGISKCVVNEDGSVTYTMSKAKHKEMLKELEDGLTEASESLISGENKVESFLEIKANKDLSEFDIYVNPDKYTAWDSMNKMTFFMLGIYYQCFAGVDFNEVDVVVNFINNETKEVMDTSSYRTFVENMNS